MTLTLSILIVVLMMVNSAFTAIPNYIHVCHRKDPAVSRCILEGVEILRPRLLSGIPELDIPSIEPFVLPEIDIFDGIRNDNFKAIGRNVQIFGLGNFQVTKLKMDIPNLTFIVAVKFPLLKFLADIDVDVKILVIPIKGQGQLVANTTNASGNVILKAEVFSENGIERIHFTNMDLNLQIDELNVKIDNVFTGDDPIGKTVNQALYENRKNIFNVIKPIAEQKVPEFLLRMANNICKRLEYNEIFPE